MHWILHKSSDFEDYEHFAQGVDQAAQCMYKSAVKENIFSWLLPITTEYLFWQNYQSCQTDVFAEPNTTSQYQPAGLGFIVETSQQGYVFYQIELLNQTFKPTNISYNASWDNGQVSKSQVLACKKTLKVIWHLWEKKHTMDFSLSMHMLLKAGIAFRVSLQNSLLLSNCICIWS